MSGWHARTSGVAGTRRLLSGLTGALLCLLATVGAWAADDEGDREYRLGSGDRLRVIVFGHEDLSGEFEVNGAGKISLPLIQLVEAEGRTTKELEALVASRLMPDYLRNPRVSIDVLSYRPFYIIGEVRNPGSYPYASNMTVVTAIAVAGGYTYRASKKKMTVIRADDPEKIRQRVTEDVRIYPGDVIEVPERFF